jgi:hypothetical protein
MDTTRLAAHAPDFETIWIVFGSTIIAMVFGGSLSVVLGRISAIRVVSIGDSVSPVADVRIDIRTAVIVRSVSGIIQRSQYKMNADLHHYAVGD